MGRVTEVVLIFEDLYGLDLTFFRRYLLFFLPNVARVIRRNLVNGPQPEKPGYIKTLPR